MGKVRRDAVKNNASRLTFFVSRNGRGRMSKKQKDKAFAGVRLDITGYGKSYLKTVIKSIKTY